MKTNQPPASNKVYIIRTSHLDSNHDDSRMHRIVLVNDDINVLNSLLERYGPRVFQVRYSGPLTQISRLNPAFKGSLYVSTADKHAIIRNSQQLIEKKALVIPLYPVEKMEDVTMVTSMGIAIQLLYRLESMKPETVDQLLEYYLHNPFLKVPIQPFHAILMAKLKKKKLNLWHLFMEFPRTYYNVDQNSICETGEKGGENNLDRYLKSMPQKEPRCLSCRHFSFCFGRGKYKNDCCAIWEMVLERLQANARKIDSIHASSRSKKV